HHTDRHRHQWYTVKLSAAILSEKITRAAILIRILVRRERVEDRHDLGAGLRHGGDRDDEDEVVAADVPDESVLVTQAFDDVVEDLREDANDAIALVVGVSVVELFEVIEVGVTGREQTIRLQTPCDLGFDLDRTGK